MQYRLVSPSLYTLRYATITAMQTLPFSIENAMGFSAVAFLLDVNAPLESNSGVHTDNDGTNNLPEPLAPSAKINDELEVCVSSTANRSDAVPHGQAGVDPNRTWPVRSGRR